jgi:hypothetical protein
MPAVHFEGSIIIEQYLSQLLYIYLFVSMTYDPINLYI